MTKRLIIAAMSGGVDSSVTALLLKQQGYSVIGLFMKNWEETDAQGKCLASKEYEDVQKTCAELDIPHYSINFAQEYKDRVFTSFLAGLKAGLTPNPDVLCNREIKFDALLRAAKKLGAQALATGHYCQRHDPGYLLKGADPEKDQSYFLYAIKQGALQDVLFPVGALHKKEVRELAHKHHLPTAAKKDSTGICFIGKRDFKPFVSQYLGYQPGDCLTLSGTWVGHHDGVAFYTLGQRRGLKLGGEGEAWYVVGKDLAQNLLFVERGADHPALFASTLTAAEITWIAEPPPSFPYACTAKIRYRQPDQSCIVHATNATHLHVQFDLPQRAIAPGQSIVFYQKNLCLGGGVIQPFNSACL